MLGLTLEEFQKLARPVYGRSNPERVENPVWDLAFREKLSGYALRQMFGDPRQAPGGQGARAAHRTAENGPVWSWQRFGQSVTELPDGRRIHISGEHEDWYDPDFCIFNDVVVEHPGGAVEFYAYPLEAFPPTDFHSATLIDDAIYLIGNLGYRDQRVPGRCQVARLDLQTYRIDLVDSTGPGPGWLSDHGAERLGAREILVFGGKLIEGEPDNPDSQITIDNPALHALDIETRSWRVAPHADMSIFPVVAQHYLDGRSPRFGAANPERLDHPFKQEAARSGWPPRRARLHFGDPAEKRRADEKANGDLRPADQVVWTAARRGAADLTLSDGTRLLIGGEFIEFGDEWPDRWIYNDIVRFGADGAIEVYAYPLDVIPPLIDAAALEDDGRVLIFGFVTPRYAPLARQCVALALEPVTMAARLLDATLLKGRAFFDAEHQAVTPETVSFRAMKLRPDGPERFLRFDRWADRWNAPED